MDSKEIETNRGAFAPLKQPLEDNSTDPAPSSQPVTEQATLQSHSQEKLKELVSSGASHQQAAESDSGEKSGQYPAAQSPSISDPRHHETGALMVTKTTYIIPKKQTVPKPLSGHVSASPSGPKPSATPMLQNETRNLLVPPAPSAPSSRPSQPNNQVRQSIQRSLTGILLKRVNDCVDLEMSESEVAKLVASIEMEMFNIFRNTDSKYMNKYRTIMFNLKDPRNKGLLYRVVRGEIGPFRLARMSQKDMQAIKASETSEKEATEVMDAAAKESSSMQKPEAVKVDLPSLNPARPDRSMVASQEQKKSLPVPAQRPRTSQPSLASAETDILTCMLKDTTSEHKTHLFDLKCKICTGQMLAGEEEEPVKKKPKVSETREKHESPWRKSAGDDSPLRAPPDSPEMDSPTLCLIDPSSRLLIDAPPLTIVESPASPVMDSPASPTLESPASPIMESPASPTPDNSRTTTEKRGYKPVVIPAVSTVTITRRDPRTAASRFSALSSGTSGPSNASHNKLVSYAPFKDSISSTPSASVSSQPPPKPLPKSILMKPSSSADPRLYSTSSRTVISESPADAETSQFLAKQDIVWKGFLNMLTVAKFVTKGYLVSGSAENLKLDLPDTIQIGGRILPQTVWDYVAKLKSSVTKELCVIRFHPATEEEEVAYVSLFSYFSSRGRFGVVANGSRSIKDIYLVPLSGKESIPSILQPLDGPGLEKNRPNLLLGLAVIQKGKRPGILPQEIEEKRPKVHMSKDPTWIPKPPVLYGSDKLEIFQPYDPETPASTTPPCSPPCPGSPSDSSSSSSVTIPSCLTSSRTKPPVSTSAAVDACQSTSFSNSDKDPTTASSNKTPLQTILKCLFLNKQTDSVVSSIESSTTTVAAKKVPVFSQISDSMADPIVQQYGQKSKVKKIEEEEEEDDENDFDRPYDPEEEYDPAMGYGMIARKSIDTTKADGPAVSDIVDDDVAYDPEDETIFADIQNNVVTKPPVPAQTSDSPSCLTTISTQIVTPASISTPVQTSTPAGVLQNVPMGTVVVSAATLTEQQRMLEELNKQIEEQKRQLKEQEEALRQQREAVGMFMAHFSVSDSLLSPPQKTLPVSQLSESKDKIHNLTHTVDSSNVDLQSDKLENTTAISNLENDKDADTQQDETQENDKESDKYSSAGEIGDSDVAYDPEDESLFNEIQDDVFQGGSIKSFDSSLSGTSHSSSRKGTPLTSYHSRKRRHSPKKRSHRERDRHRSPSKRSQRRSPSHSRRRRERDRRRSDRDRSSYRTRDQTERQGRHRKEHTTRRHSHGHRRSPSSHRKKDSGSLSPKQHRGPSPEVLEKSKPLSVLCNSQDSSDTVGQCVESNTLSFTSVNIKKDPDGHQLKNNVESADKGISPCPHELYSVKLETSEPPLSQKFQKPSGSGQDSRDSGSSMQIHKLSKQEILFLDKLDSTVPLREIDPPIRDSPQSPDPEPQFVKPSSIENVDSFKTEDVNNPVTHTRVSVQNVKVEKNDIPTCGKATASNILCPIVGENIDFRALNPEGPEATDEGMIEVDKQMEKGSSCYKPPEILGQVGEHSDRSTSSDIQKPGPEIDPVTKHPGPGISGQGIRDAGSDKREFGHVGPQIDLRETEIGFPGPDMRGSAMQGINPNIRSPGSHKQDLSNMQGINPNVGLHMRHCEPAMGIKRPVPAVKNSHTDTEVKSSSSYRPGPEIGGTSKPLSAMHHPCPEILNGRPDIIEKGRDQCFEAPRIKGKASDIIKRDGGQKDGGESPNTRGVRSAMMGGDVQDSNIRRPSLYCRGSGRSEWQSKHDGSPILDVRGPVKKDFQMHGRDAGLNRVDGHPGFFFNSNVTTASEGRVQRADALSPAMTDERQGQQKGLGGPIRMPGPNINYESGGSSMSCTGQDSSGSREHFREPHIRSDGTFYGPDMKESKTMHEFRRPGISERNYIGPQQYMGNMGVSDKSCDDMPNITNPDLRSPGPGVVGPDIGGPHTRGTDWNDSRSDKRDDSRGLDRRDSGPVRGRPFIKDENKVPQPDRRDPNMESQGPDRGDFGDLDIGEPGCGMSCPNVVDLRHERRGPDFMVPESKRRGPTMDNLELGMRGPGCQGFVGPVIERRCIPMDIKGPPISDVKGPWPERGAPDMEVPGPDRRGHGGPDFRGLGPEFRGQAIKSTGPGRRGPGGPDFRGPGLENRGLSMESLGPPMRGPGGPHFRGLGTEKRGPAMEYPEPDRRESGGPEFRGSGPGNRGLSMEGPGPTMRGPGGPGFRGLGPERRGTTMEGPGPDRRGHGGTDFRGPGPLSRGISMEGPGPERRGPGGPDFRGLGPEDRGLSLEGPGPERRGPGGPDFRVQGHERQGPFMEGPGPDRRGPGSQDFRVPAPESRGPAKVEQGPDGRGPAMGCQWPDIRESEFPDFSGQEHERTGYSMDSQESDRRGPDFQRRGPERRRPEGPDFRGPSCERRGPSMEHQGQNRRGPYARGPEPDFTGLGHERTVPGMESTGPHSRGQGGAQFRVPGPETGQSLIDAPGPDRRGPDIWGQRPERPGPSMEGVGPNRQGPYFRGPGHERRPQELEGSGNNRSFLGGPQFKSSEAEEIPPDMDCPESERRNPHFRGMRPERTIMGGPRPDSQHTRCPGFRGPSESRGPDIENSESGRQEPQGSGFMELGSESKGPNMESPGPGWRRSSPDFRGPGVRQKGPNTDGPRRIRDDWGGADFGSSEFIQESPIIHGQGHDRRGRKLRGSRPMRGSSRGLGPNMSNLNQGDGWKGPNFRGFAPDRRGADTGEQWPDGRVPNVNSVGDETESLGDHWKRQGNRDPGISQEGPNTQAHEHSRQGPCREWKGPESGVPRPLHERPFPVGGPGDDGSAPGCMGPGFVQGDSVMVCPRPGMGRPGNVWREPDRGATGPDRKGPGTYFSGDRDPENRGQGHDRRDPGIRELGSDQRGDPDMGNDWRQPDFRGNMEGPGVHGRGPRGPDSRCSGPGNRILNTEVMGINERFSDCAGRGSERQGVDMESPGMNRQRFEHDIRRKNCGPDLRRQRPVRGPQPERSDIRHGPGRWDTITDGPGSDQMGPNMMGPGLCPRGSEPPMNDDIQRSDIRGPGCESRGPDMTSHFSSPHQSKRFQGRSDPHCMSYNGPQCPAQNSRGNPCPAFDNLQNQQAVKPQRHRAALLPTPAEGLIRFPNRMINNPDVFSPKRKQMGHPTGRDWSRGRPVSREREFVKEQKQGQEKSPAGKIIAPIDAHTEGEGGNKGSGN